MPNSGSRPHSFKKVCVKTVIFRHLGVKRRAEKVPLLHGDDTPVIKRCERTNAFPNPLDHGGPNEHRMKRRIPYGRYIQIDFEGIGLRPERVAPHINIEPAEAFLPFDTVQNICGKHDQPCTRAVDGQAPRDSVSQWVAKPEGAGKFVHDARLAPWDDEAVHFRKFARSSQRHGIRSEATKNTEVFAEVALQGEHTDA